MPVTANQRQLSMFNDQHVFIEDFMTPSYVANGTRANKSSTAVTVEDLNTGETVMRQVKKTAPNTILTSNYVVDQLKKDMMATQRYVDKTETVIS